jgi:predicted transcriptional regulator
MMEQKLLISLLKQPVTSIEQKVYLQRVSFYKAIWKLRDAGLVSNQSIDIDDRKGKLWKLTLDGIVMARILSKEMKK